MAVSLPVFSTLWSAQEAEKIWTPQDLSKILHNGILSAAKRGGKGEKTWGGKTQKVKRANMDLAFTRDPHSFEDRFPKLKLEGKSLGYYATLPRILSRGK